MAKAKSTDSTITIEPLKQGRLTVRIIGNTGMYMNSMSVKAMRSLVAGGAKKTASERKEIKHNPEEEFRAAAHTAEKGETLLCFPAPGIRAAMATAALVTDGVKKTDVQRMVFMPQEALKIWGRPYLRMDVVKSADMNRTPDVHSRPFLPSWCAEIDVAFITPALSAQSIVALINNAGLVCGLGDFRQEKGKGSFGTFSVVSTEAQEAAFAHLKKHEGRKLQEEAMKAAEPWDATTRELMAFIRQERIRRAA